MNVRKPVDYGTMYRELAAILARNLPQMDEIYAIGKVISQRPEKGVFSFVCHSWTLFPALSYCSLPLLIPASSSATTRSCFFAS